MAYTQTEVVPALPTDRFVATSLPTDDIDVTARPPLVRGVQVAVQITGATLTPTGPADVTCAFATTGTDTGVVPLRVGEGGLAAAPVAAATLIPATTIDVAGGIITATFQLDVVALTWAPVITPAPDAITMGAINITDGATTETAAAATPGTDDTIAIDSTAGVGTATPVNFGGGAAVRVTEFVSSHDTVPRTLGSFVPFTVGVRAPPSATGGVVTLTIVTQGDAQVVTDAAVSAIGSGQYALSIPVGADGVGREDFRAQFLALTDTVGLSIGAGNATASVGGSAAFPVQLDFDTSVPFVTSLGSSGAAAVDPATGAVLTGANFDVVPLFVGTAAGSGNPVVQVGVTLVSDIPAFDTQDMAVTVQATMRASPATIKWAGNATNSLTTTRTIPQVAVGQQVPVTLELASVTGRGDAALVVDVAVTSFSTTSLAGAPVQVPVQVESVAVTFPDPAPTIILNALRRGQTLTDARSLVVPAIVDDQAWAEEVRAALASTPQTFSAAQLM